MALTGSGGVGLGQIGRPVPVRAAKPSTKLYSVKSGSGMSLQGGGGKISSQPVSAGTLPLGTLGKPQKGFSLGALGSSGGVSLVPGASPAAKPAAAPAPGPAPQAGPQSTTTEPSPYDSTYYIDLARATAAANARINGYQTSIGREQLATQNAIQQLQYNQGLQTRNAQNVENSRGGFAQGALGDTIGRIGKASLDAQSANTLRFQQDSQNWQTAITNARQGLSTEQIALALASAARLAALNAKSGGTIGDVTTTLGGGAPAAAAPAQAPGQPGQVSAASGSGGTKATGAVRAIPVYKKPASAPAAARGQRPNWGF